MAFTYGQTAEFTKAGGFKASNTVWEFIKMKPKEKRNTDFGRTVSGSNGLQRIKKNK
jgi:hypothetical protein